jgi:hypothetical protein
LIAAIFKPSLSAAYSWTEIAAILTPFPIPDLAYSSGPYFYLALVYAAFTDLGEKIMCTFD